ncbi:hypothetical protein HK097_002082, partial [Rhizophlyctis rosea]
KNGRIEQLEAQLHGMYANERALQERVTAMKEVIFRKKSENFELKEMMRRLVEGISKPSPKRSETRGPSELVERIPSEEPDPAESAATETLQTLVDEYVTPHTAVKSEPKEEAKPSTPSIQRSKTPPPTTAAFFPKPPKNAAHLPAHPVPTVAHVSVPNTNPLNPLPLPPFHYPPQPLAGLILPATAA